MIALLSILVSVVLPVFGVMAVGIVLGWRFKIDIGSLNRLGLYAAVPALVFQSMASSDLSFRLLGPLLIAQLLSYPVMALMSYLLGRGIDANSRRGVMATSMFPNSANIMLPVTLFSLGEGGLEIATLMFAFSSLMLFGLGPLVLAGPEKLRSPLALLRIPVLWAVLLGVLVNLLNIQMPQGVMRAVGILSDGAIPFVLLTLGLQIQASGWRRPSGINWVASALKLLLAPLVGYGLGRLLGLESLFLAVFVLWTAMPPAINNFMLALEFGGNAEEVARSVVLATLLSLVTLVVVVSFVHVLV